MKKLVFVLLVWMASVTMAWAAVNLNTATEEELDALPGVGPSKAAAIVADRKTNGPFKSVDDLKRVKGFGDAIVSKLSNMVSVSGGSTPTAASATSKAEKAAAKKAEKAAAKAAVK